MPIFVDKASMVDREALRLYVVEHLRLARKQLETLLTGSQYVAFWEKVHNATVALPDKDKMPLLTVEGQIKGLPTYIDTWMHTAVDSSERMDFFVATKARELSSGDQKRDYYWAMEIRHDQLVGLVRVLEALLKHIERWVKMSTSDLMNDPVFLGMADHSVEDQVYFEAEKVHRERMAL